MTLVSLLILPISLGIITKIIKKSQKHFKAQQEYLGHVNGQVEEIYGGQEQVAHLGDLLNRLGKHLIILDKGLDIAHRNDSLN